MGHEDSESDIAQGSEFLQFPTVCSPSNGDVAIAQGPRSVIGCICFGHTAERIIRKDQAKWMMG